MTTRPLLLALALSLLFAPRGEALGPGFDDDSAAGEDRPPNIVVFLVDDMGWQDTSVPFHTERTPFNELHRTPSMERLAAQGTRFSAAYVSAVCSPTRTTIMTGRNAARHRVTNWTLRPGEDPSQKKKGLGPPAWRLDGLQPEDGPTLASLLRGRGYRTIHCGKAHWGALGTPGADPRNLGFDVNIAGHSAGAPASYQGLRGFAKEDGDPASVWDVPGLARWKGRDLHLTEVLTLEASAAIADAVERERPFFLYLAHYAVHTPLEPHRPWVERYRALGLDENEARYASMIEGVDRSLGSLLFELDRLGVAEETLIVFLSDNGGLSFGPRGKTPSGGGRHAHNAPLRSGKGAPYEGGIRVPMIVSWARPRAEPAPMQSRIPVRRGAREDTPVHVDDLLPTLCSWADVDRAALAKMTLDGIDLTPLLAGRRVEREQPLLFHFPHFYNHSPEMEKEGFSPYSALRSGQWKLIYFHDSERWELYDLEADLGERRNLAAERPEILESLAERLVQRIAATSGQLPTILNGGGEKRISLP